MRKHALLYWTGLIPVITAAVCLSAPWQAAFAQGAGSNSAPATAGIPGAPPLSYGVEEVVKMYQGGIGKDVLVRYVENNAMPFHLDADGIIYLKHLGIPEEVTTALIQRDGELQKQAMAAYQAQAQAGANGAPPPSFNNQNQPAAPPPNNPAPVATPGAPPPQVAPYPTPTTTTVVAPGPVVVPDYSVYPYSYYPYYYGPNVVVGGWGPGWRGGWGPGWRGGFRR